MSFASPVYLAGLAILPLAAMWYLSRERAAGRARDAFAAPGVRPSVVASEPGWRRHAGAGIYAFALALLVLALARPHATIAVPTEQATVVLVMDRSGSMEATDVAPSRLLAARAASRKFLEEMPDRIKVGAVVFNHTAHVLHTPTTEHAAIADAIDVVPAAGSTATGDALATALRMIRAQGQATGKPVPGAVVLLSDGKQVRGQDPVAVAREAGKARIPVYTIALGTPGGTIQRPAKGGGVRSEPVPPDPQTLRAMASVSKGRTFSTADAERLAEVFEDLGSRVATERSKREVTWGFAGGALLLVAAAAGASLRWFGRMI